MPGRRRGIDAYDRYARFSGPPMTTLAFLMIPVLLIPLIRPVHGAVAVSFAAADYVIWALFAVDYGVRLGLVPDRLRFVRTHLFDLAVVVLPFLRPLRAVRALRGLGELRGLRLLQASRLAAFAGTRFGHAHAIIRRRGLHYVVGLVIAIMFAAAGLEVAFEAHVRGSNIHSYGDALWWAAVTVTSVGYGDQYPVTVAGRAVAVILMITGIALFGVVAASNGAGAAHATGLGRSAARTGSTAARTASTARAAGWRRPAAGAALAGAHVYSGALTRTRRRRSW